MESTIELILGPSQLWPSAILQSRHAKSTGQVGAASEKLLRKVICVVLTLLLLRRVQITGDEGHHAGCYLDGQAQYEPTY